MKVFELPWKRKKITLEEDLDAVEAQLARVLVPVEPRLNFVRQLRIDLVGEPERKNFSLPEGPWQRGFLVVGGIVSFFAMVIGGVRIVIAILGLIQGNKGRAKKRPAAA